MRDGLLVGVLSVATACATGVAWLGSMAFIPDSWWGPQLHPCFPSANFVYFLLLTPLPMLAGCALGWAWADRVLLKNEPPPRLRWREDA